MKSFRKIIVQNPIGRVIRPSVGFSSHSSTKYQQTLLTTSLMNSSSIYHSTARSYSSTIEQTSDTIMATVENPAKVVAERKANRVYSAEKLVTKTVSVTENSIQGVSIKVTVASSIPADSKTTVFFLTQGQVKSLESVNGFSAAVKAGLPIADVLSASEFTGKFKTTAFLPGATEGSTVVIVGLGALNDGVSDSKKHMSLVELRLAAHAAIQAVKAKKRSDVTLVIPSLSFSTVEITKVGYGSGIKDTAEKKAGEVEEVVALKKADNEASVETVADLFARVSVTSNHAFDKYWKSETAAEKNPLISAVTLVVPSAVSIENIAVAVNTAESILMARELGSERADVAHPAYMQSIAESLAATYSSIKVTSIQEDQLRAQGFNLLAAVGQSAVVPPRLVVLEYNGLDASVADNVAPIALVGKGITFDTGGLNLKPTGFMEEMHADMCGSAAVISVMRAFAVNKTKAKVVGVIALAENAIDAKSYKPFDIIESYQGSVIIGNTDAEGRLALADALMYVQNEHKPKVVLDAATLTGACVVALGEVAAGLFSNNYELTTAIAAAGHKHNEKFWALPILSEHQDDLSNDLADISSTGKTRYGGASTAAAFLEKFILPGVSWAHLDIAGTANLSSPRQDLPKGITGYGVQTFYNFVVSQQQ